MIYFPMSQNNKIENVFHIVANRKICVCVAITNTIVRNMCERHLLDKLFLNVSLRQIEN